MKIEVDVKKRYFFSILLVLLIVGAIIGVIAYGTNSPNILGHSLGEIDGFPNCGANQALTQSGGIWSCVSLTTGVQSTNYLVDNFINPKFNNYANLYDNIDSELAWRGKGAEFFDDNSVLGTMKVSGEDKYIMFKGYGQSQADKIDPKQPFDIEFKIKIIGTLDSNRPIRLADGISGPNNYVGIADNSDNAKNAPWAARIKASGQPGVSVDLTPKNKDVWIIFRIKGEGPGGSIRYYVNGEEKTDAAISVSSASVPSTMLDFYVGGLSSSGTSTILVDYVKIKTPWTDKVLAGLVK